MSRYVHPYIGARVERRAEGVVPVGPNAGKPCAITLHRDMASGGTVPVRWYTVEAGVLDDRGKPWRRCWRFTGRNFAEAETLFERDLRELALVECAS